MTGVGWKTVYRLDFGLNENVRDITVASNTQFTAPASVIPGFFFFFLDEMSRYCEV